MSRRRRSKPRAARPYLYMELQADGTVRAEAAWPRPSTDSEAEKASSDFGLWLHVLCHGHLTAVLQTAVVLAGQRDNMPGMATNILASLNRYEVARATHDGMQKADDEQPVVPATEVFNPRSQGVSMND